MVQYVGGGEMKCNLYDMETFDKETCEPAMKYKIFLSKENN
jgi:hypothetical protein